jgi:hypothetical protein
MSKRINTEQVVAVLGGAGLVAAVDTRRTRRAGYSVRQFNRAEVGVCSTDMTAEQWSTAMSALERAGFEFTYRNDQGMGARVRLAAAAERVA